MEFATECNVPGGVPWMSMHACEREAADAAPQVLGVLTGLLAGCGRCDDGALSPLVAPRSVAPA